MSYPFNTKDYQNKERIHEMMELLQLGVIIRHLDEYQCLTHYLGRMNLKCMPDLFTPHEPFPVLVQYFDFESYPYIPYLGNEAESYYHTSVDIYKFVEVYNRNSEAWQPKTYCLSA